MHAIYDQFSFRSAGHYEKKDSDSSQVFKGQAMVLILQKKKTSRTKLHIMERQGDKRLISMEELTRVIRKLKRNKTPGLDEYPVEFLKEPKG